MVRRHALTYCLPIFASLVLDGRLAGAQQSTAAIAKRPIPAVVFIKGMNTDGNEFTGSGFIVDPSGTILTNLHVIRGLKAVAVRLASGDIYDQVQVRAFDERKDLAVIQVAAFGLPTVPLGDSDVVQVGDRVVLIGNPHGLILEGSVTTGVVSGVRTMETGFRVIQTDAVANAGNSGGPLLDTQGRAVGVLSFHLRGVESLHFCIPINYARGMLATSDLMSLEQLAQKLGKAEDLFAATTDSAYLRDGDHSHQAQ